MSKNDRAARLSERLIEIPNLLARHSWSQKKLLAHFGIDRKTLRSNIDTLIRTGRAEIEETKEGREIIYKLRKFRSPDLTLDEAMVVAMAQEAIGATGMLSDQSPFSSSALSLIKKVSASLSPKLRERLDAMAQVYGAATAPAKDFARYREIIDQLVDAAVDRFTVRMRYQSLKSPRPKERDFDPYAVYFDPDGATLKVIGWDYDRQAIIPFAIDHIHGLKITRRRFTRRNFNLRQHLDTYCFNGIHGEPMTVRLRALGDTARVFAERKFHRTQRLLPGPADTTTIELRVARGRGLVRFVLSWMPEIEVLSPSELRAEVAAALRQGSECNR